MFSRAISPFTPNLSAIERILSGLNVPSVSIYATYRTFACETVRIGKLTYLSRCTTHIRRELTNDTHCMRQLCFTSSKFSIHYDSFW